MFPVNGSAPCKGAQDCLLTGGGGGDGAVIGFLWSVGLCEGVEDCIMVYGLRVVKMVVCRKLSMDVESPCCVEVGSFSVA